MRLIFSPPCTLHLYSAEWRKEGVLVDAMNSLLPRVEVFSDEISIMSFDNEPEIVLQVTRKGIEYYVLVREIDKRLQDLYKWWIPLYRSGQMVAAANVLEKVPRALRPYQKASLRLANE